MQGQRGATGHLPEVLEFEGRFMSSRPISNSPLWWHHEQNPLMQQLPDFIPITNDTGASHHSTVGQPGWNAERLNLGQSSSSNMKTGSDYIDQPIPNGWISSNVNAGVGTGSNNRPCPPILGTYRGNSNESSTHRSNHNLIRPVVVRNPASENGTRDSLTNLTSSGQTSTEHASSYAYPSMDLFRTGGLFREDNDNRPESTAVTSHSSLKRKSPEGSRDESSASASKRYVHISSCSGLQATPSSANICGPGSSGTLSSEAVHPSRSSLFDNPSEFGTAGRAQNMQENVQIRTSTSLHDSVSANSVSSSTAIRHNNHPVIHRPRLLLPPPQAVREGSNVQNRSMSVHYPVTPQQSVQLTRHRNASTIIPRTSSGYTSVTGIIQIEDMGSRNSPQRLQLPVIAPPVRSRNYRRNAVIPENIARGSLSNPLPSLPQPAPILASTDNRRRRSEQIRQALLAVDSSQGASNPGLGISLQSRAEQRATLLQTSGRNRSNTGTTGPNSTTYPFDTETRQRVLSQDGVNVRQSLLSALGSIHDQHRDLRLDVDNMSYEELLELGERIGDVKTGLSEEAIMKCLKHNKYTSTVESNKPNPEPCPICQEEYAEGEDLGALDCGHEYHTNCIKQWLVLKNLCPVCKAAASSSK
ncbi:unnamed protein product [Rhodiola kirilowii]